MVYAPSHPIHRQQIQKKLSQVAQQPDKTRKLTDHHCRVIRQEGVVHQNRERERINVTSPPVANRRRYKSDSSHLAPTSRQICPSSETGDHRLTQLCACLSPEKDTPKKLNLGKRPTPHFHFKPITVGLIGGGNPTL
ncbi:hypothetical protein V6N12_058250 [Hibiscus sabdariffa]|uniref:Uncharacterized protein n=1 Tax=Hibiscus sabdariffa TaxID=183260 RepID=A0ABR2ERN3_9ROSI